MKLLLKFQVKILMQNFSWWRSISVTILWTCNSLWKIYFSNANLHEWIEAKINFCLISILKFVLLIKLVLKHFYLYASRDSQAKYFKFAVWNVQISFLCKFSTKWILRTIILLYFSTNNIILFYNYLFLVENFTQLYSTVSGKF